MKTQKEIIAILQKLQPEYAQEGIEILGIFGSVARNEHSTKSDIDILIQTNQTFLKRYQGFLGFAKLDEIKTALENKLDSHVDLIDKRGLEQHNNRYILQKALYV